jgi:hypothetical protein
MGAHRVDELRALTDQEVSRPVQHQRALLIGAFDRDEAHRRPCYRFADCLGIGGIVLAALDIGLDVARRHKPHIVGKLPELASPMVRRGARLHADETRCQLAEKLEHLPAPELPLEHRLPGSIDAMHLEDVLGNIDPDRANLHVDGPLM